MESIIVLYQKMPRQIKSNNSCEDISTSNALYHIVISKTIKTINYLYMYWPHIHKTT
uniref:Uncharacterized protein n=1 Tax=Arundo donax TaxID=35708 RepID=A0A0A9HAG4_ARUDO